MRIVGKSRACDLAAARYQWTVLDRTVLDRSVLVRSVQRSVRSLAAVVTCAVALTTVVSLQAADAVRVTRNLQVLYTFDAAEGDVIHDRSGTGQKLDLKIDKTSAVQWRDGVLSVQSATKITTQKPARDLIRAVKNSNALTMEAWLRPASPSQSGPARIISLSSDTSQRNVTLGQEQDAYDVRLRSSARDKNGIPSTASRGKSLKVKLTHVVFTRDPKGTATIYIDGRPVVSNSVGGNFGNWDENYRLVLANEFTGDRPWLGDLHLVAIFDRALSAQEVQQNFAAGTSATRPEPPTLAEVSAAVFETKVAPLLAKHCLECHDSAIRKGKLDLSRKATTLAGGESGSVLTPGKSQESLLWELVSSDEMPRDRAGLSADEKAALKNWLDTGAEWSTEQIDPVIYVHGGHSAEVWVQRLTIPEYIATVRAAVGVDIAQEARELLPPDLRADGFRNTAYNLSIDLKHVESYARLAEIIVGRMDILKFAERFSKSRKLSTDDTMRDHVAAMGKWLFRGPLDEREINAYSGIATTVASANGDFQQAMTYIVEAMLQSPRFIYRMERQDDGGFARPVGPFELASRLSYILWGAPPDEELLQAAENGELSNRSKVEDHVNRMLQNPLAEKRSAQFVSEWLNLARLDNMRPDRKRFPEWDAQLAVDMREETLAFVRQIMWKDNRPLSDLLNAQFTLATPALAKHYGLKPSGSDQSHYDLTSVPARGGLLTQGSVLTVGGDGASMVSRGLFVLHDLLRGTINAPPPCVNTNPPPTKAGLTQRGIAEQRIADVKCGVCHIRFEPLAFGLEKFDGVGAFHERDQHGNDLRDDGEILFPGEAKPIKYKTSAELMNLLAESERVRESLTWKLTQFAMGRPLTATDAPVVAEIHQAAQKAGGTYVSVMSAIVMSELVHTTGPKPNRLSH